MSTLYVNTITPNSGDTVAVSGSLTVSGKFTIGDATTDTVAITAEVSSSIIPDVDSTYNIGSAAQRWAEGYIDLVSGSKIDVTSVTASIVSASTLTGILSTAAQANVTSVGTLTSLIVGGDISSSGQVNLTGNVTSSGNVILNNQGTVTCGTVIAGTGSFTDNLSVNFLQVTGTSSFTNTASFANTANFEGQLSINQNATISGSLTPNVGSSYALGTMAKSWGSLHVHGLAHIHTASLNFVSSSLTPHADDTYDLGSSTKHWQNLHVTTLNISSSDHNAQASVDGTRFDAATLGNKFTVKGQLQAAIADDAVSALFLVANTSINQDSTIIGNLIYSQSLIDANATHVNSLSQSNMLINVTGNNSMSFAFANSSGVAVVDDTRFTASFVIL
jgi:hypothetical protein